MREDAHSAVAAHRQPAWDGLRGLAALAVAVAHGLRVLWPQGAPTGMDGSGAFAVAVFFVLSGHVLAQTPPHEGCRPVFLRRLLARCPRLGLPVGAAVLLTWGVYGLDIWHYREAVVSPVQGAEPGWRPALIRVLEGVLWPGWAHSNPPDGSLYWGFAGSLAMLCVLTLLGHKTRAWRTAVLLLALSAGVVLGRSSIFLLALCLGALRAHAAHGPSSWRWLGLGLALYLGGFQYGHAWYGWSDILSRYDLHWPLQDWSHLLGALLLVDAVRRGALDRLLTSKPVQWLGRVAFGLYLLHFVVLMTVGLEFVHGGERGDPWLALGVCVAITLLLAAAFGRWVDRPAIAVSRALAQRLIRAIQHHRPALVLFADYEILLPLLARLPTRLAYRAVAWRSRWHCQGQRDWAELTIGQPYVHERTARIGAQLRAAGYPVPATGVQERYDAVGREELDAYRLERYGWRRFHLHPEELRAALTQRTPGRGLVVLSLHFDKALIGAVGVGLMGLTTYAAASNLTEDERIDPAIRRYFLRKYRAAGNLMNAGGFVYIETGLRRLIKGLRRGEVVCLCADVPAGAHDGSGVWVPWLGAERRMQELGLRLAAETGSDMLGMVCTHDEDGGATWHCSPLMPSGTDPQASYLHIMAFLESWVRRLPHRWWALHQLGDYPVRELPAEGGDAGVAKQEEEKMAKKVPHA